MSTDLATITESLVSPVSGEVLPATPENAASLLAQLRAFYGPMRSAIQECERVLVEESERQGTKTLRIGGETLVVTGGTETNYDIEVLRSDLAAAGCPEPRINDLISETVTHKVRANVAKQLSASPRYAEIIERSRTVREVPRKVGIKA